MTKKESSEVYSMVYDMQIKFDVGLERMKFLLDSLSLFAEAEKHVGCTFVVDFYGLATDVLEKQRKEFDIFQKDVRDKLEALEEKKAANSKAS